MGILNYVWAAGLAIVLAAFGFQEFTLRHENSVVNKRLDAEIQCLKGSQCATRLADESARGAALVTQERDAAATALAAQKAALDEQAENAVRQLDTVRAQNEEVLNTAEAEYQALLKSSTSCEAWSKQAVQCVIK